MKCTCGLLTLLLIATPPALAEVLHVPEQHRSIQKAIDSSEVGDTILIAPGRYKERIHLRTGITLRSVGDDSPGDNGLKRAENTIIDGCGNAGNQPGVVMAEDSVLDGFSITRVGDYDAAVWQQHYDSKGEQLGDDEGSVQAEGTVPAISVREVRCEVIHCIVHHNGDVGIAIYGESNASSRVASNHVFRNLGGGIGIAEGARPIIEANRCWENLRAGIGCRNASPIISGNICFHNIRAGIGCREGATPIMQHNQCYGNRRAGIGIRMNGTSPIVENNECFENEMAGIGCRDGAAPLLHNNQCHHNKMAGIGCDGSVPIIVGNKCRYNQLAGIGLRGAANAVIHSNVCDENKLVAIGVTHGSTATITANQLKRSGSAPPIVAVKDQSTATIEKNQITGGGVAAILVQGQARIEGNTFVASGEKQGTAVWIWKDSTANVCRNSFDGYRTAVNAVGAGIEVVGNTIQRFSGTAIVVKESTEQPVIHGNVAISADPNVRVTDAQSRSDMVRDNQLKPPPQ